MSVSMMHVWNMSVLVHKRSMFVKMDMWLPRRVRWPVSMLMMFVVDMGMRMGHWLVDMLVFVMLRQVQPHTCGHQKSGEDDLRGQRLAERGNRNHGSKKRRSRKIGPCPRRSEMTKSQNEQREADAISEKSYETRHHSC